MFVGPALADVGTNTYLPPNQSPPGYNYPKPPQSIPTAPIPSRVPYPQPPRPSYVPQQPQEEVSVKCGLRIQNFTELFPIFQHHHTPGMPFDFNYAVSDAPTANEHSHKASSDGDVVRGEYRVALPDGRVQVVRYTADWKNGYNAEVTYEGTPTYPSPPIGGGGFGGAPAPHPGYRY